MKRLALFALLLSSQPSISQSVIYVNSSATGSNNGTSWTNAYTSLQTALGAATDGKQIWIARGTYVPSSANGLAGGERYYHFRLKNNVAVYGGFSGSESSIAHRTSYGRGQPNETILSGDVGVAGDSTDNCYHVFYLPYDLYLGASTILDGCTITGGNANDASAPLHRSGGGIYNFGNAPTIVNCAFWKNAALYGGGMSTTGLVHLTGCSFVENDASMYGGGMYNSEYVSSVAYLVGCSFIRNTAGSGGGVCNEQGVMYLRGCAFTSNVASNEGGGMWNTAVSGVNMDSCQFLSNAAMVGGGISQRDAMSADLNDCRFIGNTATSDAGALWNSASSPTVRRGVFTGNSSGFTAGAVSNESGSDAIMDSCVFGSNVAVYGGAVVNSVSYPIFRSCTFTGNSASQRGGAVYNSEAHPAKENCLFTSNTAADGGGAIYFLKSGSALTNCTITKNTAVYGGGIRTYDSYVTLYNCILWGNGATSSGHEMSMTANIIPTGGIYTTTFDHTCFANGPGDITQSGGAFNTDACITTDPRLLGDGRLAGWSPCVDAGLDAYTTYPHEVRGAPRIQGGSVDLGAFEWTSGSDPEGNVLFVDENASGGNSGISWADAFTSLQSALDLAISGMQVWVARGTYVPSSGHGLVDDSGDSSRWYHFRLINGVALYGGFTGVETALGQRNPELNLTTLSGDVGVPGVSTDNCFHVIYNPEQTPAIDTSAVLDGFTITDGNGGGTDGVSHFYFKGAGMCNEHSSPRVVNCVFRSNAGRGSGGGMYNLSSSPVVSDCLFIQNSTDNGNGGGMANVSSSPVVTGCTFERNAAWEGGGGMGNASGSAPVVIGCMFVRDSSYIYGGGMSNDESSPIVTNSVFDSNLSGYGGGMHNVWSSAVVTNCTFAGNQAEFYGGGLDLWGSRVTVRNSIMWGNLAGEAGHQLYSYADTSRVEYSCFANGPGDIVDTSSAFSFDGQCVFGDPVFVGTGVDPQHPLAIRGTSSCVDVGNNASIALAVDVRGAGYPRKLHKLTGGAGTVDMGAYEYLVGTDPLPVTLAAFSAVCAQGGIELRWQTSTEADNARFEVERRQLPQVTWRSVGVVAGSGTVAEPREYSFTDPKPLPGRYAYRLRQIDRSGTTALSHELEVEVSAPTSFALHQNFPNPFNPTTMIRYDVPSGALQPVVVRVYDLVGREVATLVNEVRPAGSHEVTFDASGLPSGFYCVRMTSGGYAAVRKLLVAK